MWCWLRSAAPTEVLRPGEVGSKPKRALHRAASCPVTSFATEKANTGAAHGAAAPPVPAVAMDSAAHRVT